MNHINNKIKETIANNQPVIYGKIGGLEASHIYHYLSVGRAELVRGNDLFISAGIYAQHNPPKDLIDWCELYMEAIKNTDYILQWCPSQGDEYVIKAIWDGKEIFKDFVGLEPFSLAKEGWHHSLANKTVLMICPFKDTVLHQVEKYPLLWDGAEIKEVKIVQCSYPEALTGETPSVWTHKLDKICRDIDAVGDFDIAIVGCGGFSLLACDYIKRLSKPSLHLGGGLQLLFGILGARWDNSPMAQEDWYGTKHWIRPLPQEVPKYKELLEGGCYW